MSANLTWLPLPDDPIAAAALVYAQNGMAVFPCRGKEPLTVDGFKGASANPLVVRSMWPDHTDANIGGALSVGLWALDVDPKHGGVESLRALEKEHGALPFTLRQITGSDDTAEHWIWRTPPGVTVRQGTGIVGPGLDTRVGGKGYLMVCPSVHPETGRPYRWHSVMEPIEAPGWLLDLVRMEIKERTPYVPPMRPSAAHLTKRQRYAEAVLRGEAEAVATTPRGSKGQTGRNDRLNKAWWRLLQFRDVIPEGMARAELARAALTSGLDEREIAKVLR